MLNHNDILNKSRVFTLEEMRAYLEESTGLAVRTVSRPELCVVEGLKKIIQDKRAYKEWTYSLLDGEYKWLRKL